MKQKKIVALIVFVAGIGISIAKADETPLANHLAENVAAALSPTNSAWDSIDKSIEQVEKIGNPSIPLLELVVRLDLYGPKVHEDTNLTFRSARAIWILQRIGSDEAENALCRLIRDCSICEQQIIIALAIINGIDAAYGMIDRAWYDLKLDPVSNLPVAKVWWEREGRKKYAPRGVSKRERKGGGEEKRRKRDSPRY